MRTTESEAWCSWHDHWVKAVQCRLCHAVFPVCYDKVHLRYACARYTGVMAERVPVAHKA